jgi:hypothetical protein
MRSPAIAIAWEFRRRHRWGLAALAGYLLILAAIKLAVVASGQPVRLSSPQSLALVIVVPITTTFMYLLAMFSYGLAGDLAARQSMYPARMFTLPVTAGALAGWPMLYGTVAMVILWVAARLLVAWPSGFDVPTIWPALLAASLLSWTQALTWMPYGLPGLRVIVTVLWLAAIDAIVLVALDYQAREPLMLAILAPHVPLAYLAARVAVTRARRGDVPDWRGTLALIAQTSAILSNRRGRFSSAAAAQSWLEWRGHGRALPALVGILLPFELGLLFVIGETPALVFSTLAAVLLTPPAMAGFVAATVSTSNPDARDSSGVPPFLATRPLSTAALIAAKLQATVWSTLAGWLLVLAAIPLALVLSGSAPLVIERARQFRDAVGTPRALVIAGLGCAGLIAWTWQQLVQSLYIGLTGREWLIKASVFVTLSFFALLGPLLYWISSHSGVERALYDAAVWIVAILVIIKMSAAAWIATRLFDSRLVTDRTLVTGAACWCVAVLALYGVLVWFVDTPFVPRYFLGLVAILAIPLARVSAAPLALAWNRHR